jgi:flagellar basal body-associated protein FliL
MAAELFEEENEKPEVSKPRKKLLGKVGTTEPEAVKPVEKSPESKLRVILIVLAVLLFLQLAVSGFQLYRDISTEARENARQAVINQSVASYSANLDALTTQMLNDYKANVYNNTAVDTTAKQQVMGMEFNFNAMMLLVKQNSRLMQLIATTK